ncbi:unnamed protein product [Microthlaspi erraticum]|uniref:F-box domain-containing protein n=1 Tax=Microthlaspi erraticum TaxID=1685480 RepID=A0A6D2JH67_9BRAS|nr:unnamed protein product [Microthlaspi erraticum]
MKRLKQQLYADPIPVDLLIEIFSRLPRKSIDRFRCVSKFWGCILRRPDFTELFLTKSSTRPRLFFTVKADGKLFFYSSPQPQNPNDSSTLLATRYHASFPEYFPSDTCSTVYGLALLQHYNGKLRVICNPITGEFLTLPKLLLKNKNEVKAKGKSNHTTRERIAIISLGYDPINKQFKVLCMTSSLDERPNTYQVLTLESGKRLWRKMECKFHFSFMRNSRVGNEICINGVLYLGATIGKSSVIVCFDVRSEEFGFINLDKGMSGQYSDSYVCGHLTLFNYKGKLGIRDNTGRDEELVLWVIEDAQSHKWFKQTYKLPRLAHFRDFHFVGMTGTGEIVWSSYNIISSVYLYNLERKTFTRVNIQGFEELEERHTIHTFVDYVENLKLM